MTPDNHNQDRELQKDARAWAAFTSTTYTAALRQMESPMTQGLLGERVSARRLITVLNDHELIGAHDGHPILGDFGYLSDSPWHFNGVTDFIDLALITDMLRMFAPISDTTTPEVSSYSLKHTAERFLSPHRYVSNGRLIWAAAALGLRIAEPDGAGPNLLIGVSEREHDYVRRMGRTGQPQADHYRPAAYTHLQTALTQAAAGKIIEGPWVQPTIVVEPAPFHDWLILQVGRNDVVGDLAGDYSAGVLDSAHRIARTPDELLAIFHEISHSPEAYAAVVSSIAEWIRTVPSSAPVRTEPVGGGTHDHEGWGAGAGSVERFEYVCTCGDGTIIEEHDNVPGFREHAVSIDCHKCRAEWRFVDGRSMRAWGLEPIAVSATV